MAYHQRYIGHYDRYAPKVQVSIGFAANGIGSIHIFDGNMDAQKYISILGNHHLPAARRIFGNGHTFFLAHDNDKKHTARSVRQYLARRHIDVLPWPSKSPDLNLTESAWSHMTQIVQDISPTTAEELRAAIATAWQSIDNNYCQHLVDSMPSRLQAVIDANGWQTRY